MTMAWAFTVSMQADGFVAVQQTVFEQVQASASPAHSSSPSPSYVIDKQGYERTLLDQTFTPAQSTGILQTLLNS